MKEALRSCRIFCVLITPNSLRSEWVAIEWNAAWVFGKKIIPILFRSNPEDLPKPLQSYQYIDFHQLESCRK